MCSVRFSQPLTGDRPVDAGAAAGGTDDRVADRPRLLFSGTFSLPLFVPPLDGNTLPTLRLEVVTTSETSHPVRSAAADELVWEERFRRAGSRYVGVRFGRFSLAAGERVVVRTPDWSHAYALTAESKPPDGRFWTYLPGEECFVGYYGNGGLGETGFGVVIDRVAFGLTQAPAFARTTPVEVAELPSAQPANAGAARHESQTLEDWLAALRSIARALRGGRRSNDRRGVSDPEQR